MVFSIVLWMPSWGGMINGLMTLSGAWDKLRTDPIIRMMVISIGFYGMSTFEGPMMSIRAVNSLSHYTDWTIGHVHSGALGWNGMITFGALYFLVPKLWNRERLYSLSLVSWHFWLATIGIILYAASMWVTGIMEGLMWREVDANGFLVNSFADTVAAKLPMYVVRGLGGVLYVTGAVIMCYNLWMTVKRSPAVRPRTAQSRLNKEGRRDGNSGQTRRSWKRTSRFWRSLPSSWSPSGGSCRSPRCSGSRTPSRM